MEKNIDFGGVADVYDTYVQWEEDVPFFVDACRGSGGEVLELMSGTGRLSLPLLRAGYRLCCTDYSEEMLDVLRKKLKEEGLQAEVIRADVRELQLERRFGRILLPFHSVSELLEREDRVRALRRVREHLAPGGRFFVTLQNPALQIPRLDGARKLICDRELPEGAGRLRVWTTARFDAARDRGEALQEYEIRDAAGGAAARRELRLRFAILERGMFEAEAAQAGLRPVRLWGDYRRGDFDEGKSLYMIWEMEAGEMVGDQGLEP